MDQPATLRKTPQEAKAEPHRAATGGPRPRRPGSHVVSLTSGKGGVGKTNLTANLAYLIARTRRKTMVFDADCGLANIDILLGLAPRHNLYHVLKGERSLQQVIVKGPGGIRIVPSSSGIQQMSGLSVDQKLLLQDELRALEERPDLLLIDTGAGIAENVMYFNMLAGEIVVVVTPEPTSLTDAYALIKLLYQRHAKKRFCLLVNMVRNRAEGKEVFVRMAQATNHFLNLSIEDLGHVVFDEQWTLAVKQQRLLAELYPDSPSVKCLRDVAAKLCAPDREQETTDLIKLFD